MPLLLCPAEGFRAGAQRKLSCRRRNALKAFLPQRTRRPSFQYWRYQVEGDTPLDVSIKIPVSDEEYPKVSPGLTAHPVVNAIPYVCEAAPGIRHTYELPPIIAFFGGS